jgi:leader peptidase (prepilin peptidase) / N-methyltransferase
VTEALLAGLLGALIGSFLNVCIYRLPRDLSVVQPRSFCPNCESTIAWYDNIPIGSYLALSGRCRECRASIPFRYPLVEFLTAAAFFLGVYTLDLTAAALKFCVFAAMQIALLFTDLEERILPDEFTLGGAVLGIAFAAFVPPPGGFFQLLLPQEWDRRIVWVIEAAVGALFLSGVLWGIGELYQRVRHREGLGLGDVKMVAMIAAFLGISGALFTVVVGSVLGSVLGSLCGLGYIWLTGKDAATYELPFGSFLAVAALLVAMQMGPFQALFR